MLCSEKRARLLLKRGRARVHRIFPVFTIRLVDRTVAQSEVQPVVVSVDPGSKKTGVAVARLKNWVRYALVLIELIHKGQLIKDRLKQRKGNRRQRRSHLRYRAPRFDNRTRKRGWLPPSLQHRVDAVNNLIAKLRKLFPISSLAMELVKFDLQKLENPEVSGIEYHQGTLQGYEVREYLLEKWNRKCAYCGVGNVPLQVEHIQPKARGGTNRISNLCLSCGPCNTIKGTLDIREFLKRKPDVLTRILAQAKKPLKDATAVNATRWALYNRLRETDLSVEVGSGGRTKFNRSSFCIPKDHALDALCVGDINGAECWDRPTVTIKAMGRGAYKRSRTDASGRVISLLTKCKTVKGFQTGDMVKAVVQKGKKVGSYFGRVAVRITGSFNIQTAVGVVQGIGFKNCFIIQRADGYNYDKCAFYPDSNKSQLIKICIIIILLFPMIASAGVIGTVGRTYPFAERDALTEVQEAAKQVNWKKLLSDAKESARHYRPTIPDIHRATAARKHLVEMSYTLDVDVPDPRDPSRVLYPKGFSFNPLQYMSMPACVVFVNTGDRAQRNWLISSLYGKDLLTPILLTGGDVDSIERVLKRPAYLADSVLLERFGIEAVPSVACQKGISIEVEEIDVDARKNVRR